MDIMGHVVHFFNTETLISRKSSGKTVDFRAIADIHRKAKFSAIVRVVNPATIKPDTHQ